MQKFETFGIRATLMNRIPTKIYF